MGNGMKLVLGVLVSGLACFIFMVLADIANRMNEIDQKEKVELLGKQHNLSIEGVRDIQCIGGYFHYLPNVGKNTFRYEPIVRCAE